MEALLDIPVKIKHKSKLIYIEDQWKVTYIEDNLIYVGLSDTHRNMDIVTT